MRMTDEVRGKWKSLHSHRPGQEGGEEKKKLVVGQLQRRRRLKQQNSSTYSFTGLGAIKTWWSGGKA